MTLAGVIRQDSLGRQSAIERVALVVGGAALMALSSRAVLPLAPVPVTAQTFAVLLLAGLLGRQMAVSSVLTFLAAGAMGVPVFAHGGGLAYLLGPTGGYLLGFLPAAWIVGHLAEKGWRRRPLRCVLMLLLGDAVLFAFGLAWLSALIPAGGLLRAGLLPFIPGEAVKIALAGLILSRRR